MKSGIKLKSLVCDTEVLVIRAGETLVECGGAPMAEVRSGTLAALNPNFSGGTKIGKRYVDSSGGVELLCVKQGVGSLAIDGVTLEIKEAKPLPSSD